MHIEEILVLQQEIKSIEISSEKILGFQYCP